MKKLLIAIIILLFILTLPSGILAYADNDVDESLEQEVVDALEELDYSELEDFFSSLEDNSKLKFGNSVKDILNAILSGGNSLSFTKIYQIVLDTLKNSIFSMLPMIMTILVIGILYGISSSLTSSFLTKSTNEIIYYVCFGAIIIVLITTISGVIVQVRETIDNIARLVDIVFPLLLTIVTALGGISTVAVYQPSTAIFATVIVKVIVNIVMPLFIASIIFCLIGSLSYNVKLDKLTNTSKSAAEWIMGILFALFIAFITVEGITGATFDTITVKSAKFAISSYIPIIGGHISEGFDLVMASLILLKNSFGLISIIILFIIIISPIIEILLISFLLKIAAAILEPISDKRISDLLFNIAKLLNLLLLIIIGLAFIVFIMIILIIVTFNMGVV